MALRPPHPRKQEALEMLRGGATVRQVAEALGIKANTVKVWKKRAGITRGSTGEGYKAKTGRVQGKGTGEDLTTPSNVISIHEEKRGKKRERDREGETAAERLEDWKDRRTQKRLRAMPRIDRVKLLNIARRLIDMLDTGLMCPACDGDDAQPLTAQEFSLYTRSYTQHLDRLSSSVNVEELLKEEREERGAEFYETPEGHREISRELRRIGPRLLTDALKADPEALRILRLAVDRATGLTG